MTDTLAAVALDGGELSLGEGLLALLRPALLRMEPGAVLVLRSRARSVGHDLPTFCRIERHEYRGCVRQDDGSDLHTIARGTFSVPRGEREGDAGVRARDDGRVLAADVLARVPMPERADPHSGFAPRGAQVEPGGPAYPYTLLARDHVAPPDVAQLYDQAASSQWDGARDIPWARVGKHPAALEDAVAQTMTFLAENELSALYVPSRFIARIHPAYVEAAMFLATQLADESRHIDVFMKRARIAGAGAGVSSTTTSHSLLTLLETADFTESAFLLSVLGEGTFLDLLRFVETHAPDEATAEIARRTRTDEARHVHFGISHVRHALARDAALYARLEAAVRRRAATLHGVGGVPAPLQDALTVLAARGTDPKGLARGHEAFRELLHTMHEGRIKRLVHAGFTHEQAENLSSLHTPNFM